MPIRGGLQPYNRVFNASDAKIAHGSIEVDKEGKVISQGNDHRFDKYAEAKQKENLDKMTEKDKEIERLKKLLAQKEKQNPAKP